MRMRTFLALLTLALMRFGSVCADEAKVETKQDAKPEVIGRTDPRARPMIYAIIATLDSDVDVFQFAFARRIREKIKADEWPKMLEVYREQFQGLVPSFSHAGLVTLRFEFRGDDMKGILSIVDKEGNAEGGMRMIKEEGAWKFNER